MKYLKWAVLVGIIMVSALIILNISYFLNGSLELYPAEEQERKVKLVTGIILFALFIIEAILVILYRKVNT